MELELDKLAYCGIYCPQCSFLTAYETGERAHLLHMPAKYDAYKQAGLSEWACGCCKGENVCGQCGMKDCVREKGLISCADCASFPCPTLQNFADDGVPHHRWALENLLAIKQIGYAAWFAGFKANLSGPNGERLSWYCK